ncbi:MAG: Crp/Fnr family transcriptional regulator [Janthinobacterium lividum]
MKRNALEHSKSAEVQVMHPVLMAFPEDIKRVISSLAKKTFLDQRDAPPKGHLYFLTSGVLGIFARGHPVCSGLIVPGSVHGWETLLDEGEWRETRALLPCEGFSVPLEPLRKALSDPWMFRFLAVHAVARTRDAATEASCNAIHTASQRTAKWIMRLHRAVTDPKGILITQARLAEILGFQRTSINASCGYLKDRGAIEIRRGRVVVTDVEKLRAICCSCDTHREPVRRPLHRQPEPMRA